MGNRLAHLRVRRVQGGDYPVNARSEHVAVLAELGREAVARRISSPCRASASLAKTPIKFASTGWPHLPPPSHLPAIADNTPSRLILSRTRDHGIDLSPLGLPGLVLDPRAGVHSAVLSTASASPSSHVHLGLDEGLPT